VRQVTCLDAGRPRADPRLVERSEQGRAQLARRVGRSSEVVRPVRDRLDVVGTDVREVEVGADEDGVVVPANAVQISQSGTFVFVIQDGIAQPQPVKVERQVGTESVIASGLNGGETVVTEGQLLLSKGTRVNVRTPKIAGS